ncbi:MAG TPA: aspartate aminotransferase family protein [Kofleriaceae bacterium]|nr:aspartate aminotransferase family protein [Kofleriaceae bacterium]
MSSTKSPKGPESPDKPSLAPDLVSRDGRYVLRPWSGTGEPVPVVEAKDCLLTDANGKQFIDFTSGYFVNQAGHCHPRVVKAATEQLGKVTQVSGRHTTPPVVDLAERLVQLSPRSVDRVFFTTGGTEANEFAFKMVRQYTGKTDIAYLDNAYHGLTLGTLAACASQKYRDSSGVPLGDYTYQLPNPYCYRCPHEQSCETQCLDEWEERLDARADTTAAIVAESAQAVGGIAPPAKWWARADEIRKKRGLLLILDEIQTGLGRTGKMFGAEHYDLEPDLMSIGKGISGGVGSLGGVLCRSEVVAKFFGGTTPTSAGNAVSAAAGCALIDTVIDEKLCENAAAMGIYFTQAVAALEDPWVGDIRFQGLLGGVELVRDRKTKQVLAKEDVTRVKDSMHEDGILLTVSGPLGNVLRLQPPLTVTRLHIDACVAALARALETTRGSARP